MEREELKLSKHTADERKSMDRMLNSKRGRNKLAEHEGLPVSGYRAQSDFNVNQVNHHKDLEERILRLLDILKANKDMDQRWLAIGRTHIEEGFMAINRAVFKPERVKLPEDEQSNENTG